MSPSAWLYGCIGGALLWAAGIGLTLWLWHAMLGGAS